MKKLLLTISVALLGGLSVKAAKAWPYPITLRQSDGSTITVYLHGDENFSWYTDALGNVLQRTGNDFTPITTSVTAFFAEGQKMARRNMMKREPIASNSTLFPHQGSPKAVVILAQYSDLPFTLSDPRASFDQYLNLTDAHPTELGNGESYNYASAKQYFIDQSDSAFIPQFDIYGPVTLPNTMAYYGGTNDTGSDERYTQLVADACEAAIDSVDFSQYDSNNDGAIDLVYVIYSGYGQSMGGANETIWPKSFYYGSSSTYDGMKIGRCGVTNELIGYEGALGWTYNDDHTDSTAVKCINGIGLFCHEFSHCLGLPDFYPTSGPAQGQDNQGMEDWSLMDNGEYVSYGWCPPSYTAWEREALGWYSIDKLSEKGQYTLTNVDNGGKAYKIVNPNDTTDYFVLQCFEDKGWNQRIARSGSSSAGTLYNPETRGLLLYHVDYDATAFSLTSNTVNNVQGHPRMTVVPADGNLDTSYKLNDNTITRREYAESLNGDIFKNDSTFMQSSGLPNAAWWTNADDQPIYNINYTDSKLYIDYLDKIATTGINELPVKTVADGNVYSLGGNYLGKWGSVALPKGVYIVNGKKLIVK